MSRHKNSKILTKGTTENITPLTHIRHSQLHPPNHRPPPPKFSFVTTNLYTNKPKIDIMNMVHNILINNADINRNTRKGVLRMLQITV
jgi:hypothetical protein